jgi:hypothetical protein
MNDRAPRAKRDLGELHESRGAAQPDPELSNAVQVDTDRMRQRGCRKGALGTGIHQRCNTRQFILIRDRRAGQLNLEHWPQHEVVPLVDARAVRILNVGIHPRARRPEPSPSQRVPAPRSPALA